MQAPARDPSDFDIANSAETALLRPEKAKSRGTPERVQHMRTFPIFEIGFVCRIVRVGFALHFNVSFNGGAKPLRKGNTFTAKKSRYPTKSRRFLSDSLLDECVPQGRRGVL